MRVLGVIDLLGGRAVHARRGERDRYEPLQASGGERIDGDPMALARVYRDRFGIREIYVADLDAILGRRPQRGMVTSLAEAGVPVWLDAGVSSVDAARDAIDSGASRIVVGLETLTSFEALADICGDAGCDRVAFSLDLRDGVPLRQAAIAEDVPERLAACAGAAGAAAILVIDLRRVGSGRGVDLSLLARIRRSVPRVTLLAGGGLSAAGDLEAVAEAGCNGVLLATALHTGGITAADLAS